MKIIEPSSASQAHQHDDEPDRLQRIAVDQPADDDLRHRGHRVHRAEQQAER
jgi:hypothetical protein